MDTSTTVNAHGSRTQRTILYDDDVRVVHTHTARHCYSIIAYKSASEVRHDRAIDRRRLRLPLRSRPCARSPSM